MSKMISRFEDLIAWQKARALPKTMYQVTTSRKFSRDFGLSSQLQRAAVSVMANIAEGFERNRAAEFHQYLSIAKGSCAELRSHLYVAFDAGYLDLSRFDQLLGQAEEVARLVGGLCVAVQRHKQSSIDSTTTQSSARSTQHNA
ncbi:MAG: four helix bundle protein [Nitrospiraceae bacterium]